jgi:hypothetical protein
MKETRFLAHVENKGFYADDQPKYEYSYTHDELKAKLYKTMDGVTDILERCGDKNGKRTIVKVERQITIIEKIGFKGSTRAKKKEVDLEALRQQMIKDREAYKLTLKKD